MFHVGQKVVCIWKFMSPNTYGETYPLKGHTYTVRGIEPAIGVDGCALLLEEIVNEPRLYWTPSGLRFCECNFWEARFRPVHTTDIAIFEAMLVPTLKEKVEA